MNIKSLKLWIIMSVTGLVAAGAVLTYNYWPREAPDPADQSPEQMARYMASDQFARLDPDQKQLYAEKAGWQAYRGAREHLSEEERRRLRENVAPVFRRGMEDRINQFFELPPEQRTAYLDEMIDRMPQRPSGNDTPRPPQSGEQGPRRGFTPDRLKRMIENTTPEQRARFVEFMKAFRQRMEERGLQPGRFQ